MASYADIPMNSLDRYIESMRTRRPGISAERALAAGQGNQPVIRSNTPAPVTPERAAFEKFLMAQQANDAMLGTYSQPEQDALMAAEAEPVNKTGMDSEGYARQKAQEQAVTNAALAKFMAAQNRAEAIDPRMVQQ